MVGYNPIGRVTEGIYSFPVNSMKFDVVDGYGDPVVAQVSALCIRDVYHYTRVFGRPSSVV